jgi:type I restriction enzyme S subunit
MVVEKGYKQTEVGVIPEDWIVTKLGDVIEKIVGGGTPSRSNKEYWGNEIPWVTVKDFATFNASSTQEYITKKGLENSASHLIPKYTLITSTRMGLGKAVIYEVDVSINQDLKALATSNRLNTKYLFYWFQKNSAKIERLGSGSTVMGISLTELKNILFSLPPISEQTAIANALSDMDALITQTEKLIEKKKAIKQGVMQELLKPKEGWVEVKIRDVGKVGRGRVISQNEISKAIESKYPVYSSQTSNNGIMGYIDSFDFEGEYITWTTDGEKAGTVFYRNGKFNCTNVCGTIKLKGMNPRFISYVLAIEAPKHVSRNLANPKLMNEPMKNISIKIPIELGTQNQIENCISGIEHELDLLTTKLQKLKLQKQGMMQALLTGKIRLI